ncbi:MAG: 5'-methylthioadenosine/adenosylhomocysteine nucleosidase [Verrucomicrobia bacterium]|nr:5'-methylthioadenosine/adenosylhomocysteine nucleosidase [Verrucomicrobiota bacterium]
MITPCLSPKVRAMRRATFLTRLALAVGIIAIALRPAIAAEPTAAPLTCILGAFDDELTLLYQALAGPKEEVLRGIHFASGKLKGRSVIVCRSGIGKVNAAMVTTLLIEHYQPSEIIFCGIAGGINPDLHPGDIVIAAKTAQHDFGTLRAEGMEVRGTKSPVTWQRNPLFVEPDARLMALAEAAGHRIKLADIKTSEGERHPRIIKGIVATGDIFVASPAKKAELRKTLGADAVEMEGAAVAQVCRDLRVSWLVIRSISDRADHNALQDVDSFTAVAAQNAAQLVMDIVGHLAAPPATGKAGT